MHSGGSRVLIAIAIGGLAIGCAGPEEELVNRFLTASQRGENELVAALSMVSFPEEVVSWDVLEVVDLPTEDYPVPTMRQRVEEAEDARDAQFKAFGEFRQDNYDALTRIQNRTLDDPDYHFSGEMGALQAEWERQRQERRNVVTRVHETELALEREIRQVNKSLQRESNPEYLTGETTKKAVLVRVMTPGSEKTYRIILSRYDLKNQFDAVVPARFIITELHEKG